jgi:ABC-type Mn2+/Zn2+ transport system permease subunit
MLTASFIIAVSSGLAGIILSINLNIPTSGAIALVSIALFSAVYIHKALTSL